MAYVNNYQYKDICNLRDTIDGELNRIAVTDDMNELLQMQTYLEKNIKRYIEMNKDKINGEYHPRKIPGGNIKL